MQKHLSDPLEMSWVVTVDGLFQLFELVYFQSRVQNYHIHFKI